MKPAIHLLDPVNGYKLGSHFPTMRCGRTQNVNSAQPLHTSNPAKVTCTSCKSYMNNPWRILRKYAQVIVIEDMFVMLLGQYGYKFDMCAVIEAPGTWTICVAHNRKCHVNLTTKAGNMAQLGFKLVDILEKEIMQQKKSN